MQLEQIRLFLAALGAKNIQHGGGAWVQSSCPLAVWTHKGGMDSHPSFGIRINDSGPSSYNCWACNSGPIESLIQDIEMRAEPHQLVGIDLKAARLILENQELQIIALPEFSEFASSGTVEFEEWPSYFIEQFMPWRAAPLCRHYVLGRVPEAVADHFNLKWDLARGMVAAPYKDVYGRMAGMRGRSIHQGLPRHLTHHDYTVNGVNNAPLCWYNEGALASTGPVLVVEGQFDVQHCWQVTDSVIGGLGSKPTPAKLKKLLQAELVILMMDKDPAGVTADAKISDYLLYHNRPVARLDYTSPSNDPATVDISWLRDELSPLMPVKSI